MTAWRTSPLPKDWKRIRSRVLKRDQGMCQWPGCSDLATEVDHMAGPDDHRLEVLRSLCRWHHARVTSRQANAARWSGPRQSRTRPPEAHPGLL